MITTTDLVNAFKAPHLPESKDVCAVMEVEISPNVWRCPPAGIEQVFEGILRRAEVSAKITRNEFTGVNYFGGYLFFSKKSSSMKPQQFYEAEMAAAFGMEMKDAAKRLSVKKPTP